MRSLKMAAWALGTAFVVAGCNNAPDEQALQVARDAAVAEYKAQEEARLAENKKIASAFFAPGVTADDRYALLHDEYIQHNPVFKKAADEAGVNYKQGFKDMMTRNMANPPPAPDPKVPAPPQGNPLYQVLAEGDLVFIMRQQFRQDPTKEPGNFYEAFAWDTFRIKDGKLYEHWDGAVINPPAPAAGARR
jgi:predicted SnoaL-like aldol condensation-catalyzing enzyme